MPAKDHAGAGSPQALSTLDDLMRRADWPRLSGEQRAALLRSYATTSGAPARQTFGLAESGEDTSAEDWLADTLAPQLQPEAVAVVRTWIEGGPPDAHLCVVGPSGRGRTSVVVALARRAMAQRPPAPDYCYVPDPSALGHTLLLALPYGAGVSFAEALGTALRQVLMHWEKPRERARSEGGEELDDEGARHQLIERHLRALAAEGLPEARGYLERLAAALSALVGTSVTPQVVEVDAPAGRPAAIPGSEGIGAPVIVATLARMDLGRSLLRANGGVLVLPAADLVDREQTNSEWATLRAALRTGSIHMRGTGEPAVPLAVRVALIGSYAPFRQLERAEDFGRLFRYKARFDDSAAWTPETEAAYAALADGVARRYTIPPFDHMAVACLIEEGARRASDRNRSHVTTDLLTLRDIAVEAGRHAQAEGASAHGSAEAEADSLAGLVTSAAHVEAALAARRIQQGAAAREAREAILMGREIVPTAGAAIGQINGLSVSLLNPVEGRFATPFRVTATVSPGRERLVDIEREAESADSSHISGALTMAGYLAWRYGRQRSINVVARLRFEENHGYVSGPSASAAELFALLSALSGVPIRAALAVTGAVGQYGELQVIGSANDKIEGFWAICRARRAAGERPEGDYGVIIPAANAGDVMLRAEVAESIAHEAWFHIWPIAHIDEGLPLLTGRSAAEVHQRVERELQRYYELALRMPDGR